MRIMNNDGTVVVEERLLRGNYLVLEKCLHFLKHR